VLCEFDCASNTLLLVAPAAESVVATAIVLGFSGRFGTPFVPCQSITPLATPQFQWERPN
jgi:hypothetical protein